MSRLLATFLYGNPLRTTPRGKCRYGPRHESVQLVDGEWLGEDSYSYECALAPEQQCTVCAGAGEIELSAAEAQLAQYDEAQGATTRKKPCLPCRGLGYVAGPHWPFRFPEPPPLRTRTP
jgi:hypothetical protein